MEILKFTMKYQNSKNCFLRSLARFFMKYAGNRANREEQKILKQNIRKVDPEKASSVLEHILNRKHN